MVECVKEARYANIRSPVYESGVSNFVILAVTTFLLNGTHYFRQVSQGLTLVIFTAICSPYFVPGVIECHSESRKLCLVRIHYRKQSLGKKKVLQDDKVRVSWARGCRQY